MVVRKGGRGGQFGVSVSRILHTGIGQGLPHFIIGFLGHHVRRRRVGSYVRRTRRPRNIKFFARTLGCINVDCGIHNTRGLSPGGQFVFTDGRPLKKPRTLVVNSIVHGCCNRDFQIPIGGVLTRFRPLSRFFAPMDVNKTHRDHSVDTNVRRVFSDPCRILVCPTNGYTHGRRDGMARRP